MNIQVQKQKEDEQITIRKKQLLNQINQIKHKLTYLQQIETQIQALSGLLKTRQKSNKSINLGSNLNTNIKEEIQTNAKLKLNSNNNNYSSSNTNKKIKIYELQKKLASRNKEYKDQHIIYLSKLKNHQQMLAQIFNINSDIRKQKDISNQLIRLFGTLGADLNRIQQKCKQNSQLLKKQKEALFLYEKQKIKKIEEIKKLKKIIKKGSQMTEADQDDIVLSVQEQQNQNHFINLGQEKIHFQLNQHNQETKQNQKRKYSEQILLSQDSNQEDDNKNSNIYKNQSKIVNQNKQHSSFVSKLLINKSFDQLQSEVSLLEQLIEKNTKKHNDVLQSISLIKKGNKNLQAKIKHSRITLDLLKNKVQYATKTNQQECAQLIQNIAKLQLLYGKLRAKQGKLGQLRGNLGIKVQNTRMLGIINEEINLDYQKMNTKVPLLKNLSAQCLQILHRFFSYQKLINQNLQIGNKNQKQ